MYTRIGWVLIIVLSLIIAGLALALVFTPAPTPPITATTTPPVVTSTSTLPLSARVVVISPASGATVEKTFVVVGSAPGPWYFEASFPIKVVDANNNFIGQGIAQAQSDWMTVDQVAFRATTTVTGYSGPATLVLMRDNPSGMPENDDSISIPIVIQ